MSSTPRADTTLGISDLLARAVTIVRDDLRILGVVLAGGVLSVIPVVGFFVNGLANGVAVDMATRTFEDVSNRGGARLSTRLVYLAVGLVILGVVVGLGLLLLVIPGIYLLIRFYVFPAAVMVDGNGPLQGLSRSWSRTSGHALTVFGFIVVMFLASFVILALLYVGVFGVRPPQTVDSLSFRLLAGVVGAPFGAVSAAGTAVMYDAFDPRDTQYTNLE